MDDNPAVPKVVSVIIPTYNRADLLPQAIRTALQQNYPGTEIIVIDDGSTDETAQVMRQFPDVRYVRQDNQGPSSARNNGLKHATGKFVAYLDSDDLWNSDLLHKSIAALDQTGADLAFSNWRFINADGSIDCPDYFRHRGHLKNHERQPHNSWFVLQASEARELQLRYSTIPVTGTVLRRNLIRELWADDVRAGEDRIFMLDYILNAQCKVVFTNEVLWSYRLHSGNSYARNINIALTARNEIESKQTILRKHSSHLNADEVQHLRASIAANYFDWAYYESQQGHRRDSIKLYCKSLKVRPAAKTFFALLKACAKLGR